MGRVRREILIGERPCWCLFDTGARNSYVIKEIAVALPSIDLVAPQAVALGGRVYDVRQECLFTCLIEGLPVTIHARVLEEIGTDEEGKRIEVLLGHARVGHPPASR
jgi:hypothetical protein